jgi:hypothetical protein
MLNLHLLAHMIARRRMIYSIEHWFVAFHWSLVLYNNRCVKLLIILSEVIMFGRLHGMEWFLCDFSDTARSVKFQRHHELLTRLTLPFICTLSVFLEYNIWISTSIFKKKNRNRLSSFTFELCLSNSVYFKWGKVFIGTLILFTSN